MFTLFPKKQFLDKESQLQVVACIKEAEDKTSGEIRVFMEPHCTYVDPLERAKEIFSNLAMEKTAARNAVIIYVAFTDRQFALFGDTAIYEKAGGAAFWKKAAAVLAGHMKKQEYTQGLCNCIRELGSALAANFPPDSSIQKNELPDEIVFGK
ncbi:MAG: TPM domain-containing protein [Taibaiella sp.]|nr:TPM domain-containing protein [Taibaiella sp.]